tara:strand:- start:174 stop:434 length:261 start_codon:yes stop_codon:yes gene_type:complete
MSVHHLADYLTPETERAERHAETELQMHIARHADADATRFGYVLEAMNEPDETAFDRAVIRIAPWFLIGGGFAVIGIICATQWGWI